MQIRNLLDQTYGRLLDSGFDNVFLSYLSDRRNNRSSNTFRMSEYRQQNETCVTQIPESTPLAPAVPTTPIEAAASIIDTNIKNGSR